MPNDIPLLSYGITSETQDRISLYKAMKIQRRFAPSKSMKWCNRKRIPADNRLRDDNTPEPTCLLVDSKGARFTGLQSCDSQWCVSCMANNRQKRIDTINRGIATAHEKDFNVFFLTLTIPRSDDPRDQAHKLQSGWKALQDKLNYRLKKQGNRMFFVRAHDVTFKLRQKNIYHQHLHNIVVIEKDFQPFTEFRRRKPKDMDFIIQNNFELDKKGKVIVDTFERFMMLVWYDVQQKKDTDVSFLAQDVQRVGKTEEDRDTLSHYLLKFWSLGNEMACFQHKQGKKGKLVDVYNSIGFMQLLGFVDQGDKQAELIYTEFLKGVKGLRTMGKSRNWKELAPDIDEEIIEIEGETKTLEMVVPVGWFDTFKYHHNVYKGFCGTDIFLLICFHHYSNHKKGVKVIIDQLFECSPNLYTLRSWCEHYSPF